MIVSLPRATPAGEPQDSRQL